MPEPGIEPLFNSRRAVQTSLLPDLQPDKPIGPILPSVFRGSNADLIRAVAPLYLTGSVLDMTYGEGGWWQRFKPELFTAHDLYKLDGVDFTALPEADDTYDAVCFDPPYVPAGGYLTSTAGAFHDNYGLRQQTIGDIWQMLGDGIGEAARVSRRWVLVKCMDFVSSAKFHLGHLKAIEYATSHGLVVHDLIVHHAGAGPGGHTTFEVLRARRHHSYLIVFTPGKVVANVG